MKNPFTANGRRWAAGTHFIPAKPSTLAKLQKLAADVGLDFEAVAVKPPGEALMLQKLRIGLVDRYGGSMPSGWIRYELEKFEFPVHAGFSSNAGPRESCAEIRCAHRAKRSYPCRRATGGGGDALRRAEVNAENIPAEFRDRVGAVTLPGQFRN